MSNNLTENPKFLKAMIAIESLFGDMSVEQEDTQKMLCWLRDEINDKIDALE